MVLRRLVFAFFMTVSALGTGGQAYADCVIIHQIDNLHTIQSRLARNPDSALFITDIRQLRAFSRGLSHRGALDAVDGNAFTGQGAEVVRFLQNTQALLQRASLDDPDSVRPHFTPAVRSNLAAVRGHLRDLRCNDDQIAVETAQKAERRSSSNSDAEDLAEVAETINALAEEVFQLRSLILFVVTMTIGAIVVPAIRRWRHLRMRRAKRHNATYQTRYIVGDRETGGMLIDINCHGTKLRHQADNPLAQGTAVEISVAENWVAGTVMWSNAHYSGVQFKSSIGLIDVETICAQPEIKQGSVA